MRFIRVRAGIFNPTVPDKVIEVDGIIDAGAIYTVIRRGILKELDIKPSSRRFRALKPR